MKNIFSILCMVLFLLSCAEEHEVTQLQNRNGLMFQLNQEKPFSGTYVEYSVYGPETKRAEENYKNGKKDGLSILWKRDGQKASEGYYKDGKQNGRETVWYLNGQKASEGNYRDGRRNGSWKEWYTNGLKWKEGSHKDGKKDGLWTEWDEDGNNPKTKTYKNGSLVEG